MPSWALAVLAVAGSAEVKVAMPALRMTDIPVERAGFYTEQLAAELIAHRIRVVTEREISALLGLERQRELLGCSDGSSACLVELANALGVDGVVLGDVAKVGSRFQVSLRVIDAKNGTSLALASFRAPDEEGVVDGLVKAAATLAADVTRALGRAAPPPVPSAGAAEVSGTRRLWWIPAAGAVLALGAGAACLAVSRSDFARLDPAGGAVRIGLTEAETTARRGDLLQTASVALFITGGAAALAAVGVVAFGGQVQLGAALTPSTVAIGLSGALP
jgi:hypothetical protein